MGILRRRVGRSRRRDRTSVRVVGEGRLLWVDAEAVGWPRTNRRVARSLRRAAIPVPRRWRS